MDTQHWLARCADFFIRLVRKPPDATTDISRTGRDRRRAARSLHTRLPARLRQDIGVEDRGADDG